MRNPDLCLCYRYAGNLRDWTQVIADVFQPQQMQPACAATYRASIRQQRWQDIEITHYESGASRYERTRGHIGSAVEDYFFVTLPRTPGASMTLAQSGRSARLGNGQLVLHHGAEAAIMELSDLALTALRIRGPALRDRMIDPERRCVSAVAGDRAAGALFVSLLDALAHNAETLEPPVREQASSHLFDLLAMALDDLAGTSPQLEAAARTGHLARALRYIATHYRERDLSPQTVAAACGISLRYLHRLFAATERSVAEHIIESRLLEAHRLLRTDAHRPVGEIAYACGFGDLSHFARRFRARFDKTAGDVRRAAVPDAAPMPVVDGSS